MTKSELTKQELTRWEVEKIFHLICFYLKTLGWMHGDAVLIYILKASEKCGKPGNEARNRLVFY